MAFEDGDVLVAGGCCEARHPYTSLTSAELYDPSTGTFYTYDNPLTATLKMLYVNTKAGGLGGAYVWALKDDDPHGTMVKTMATYLSP